MSDKKVVRLFSAFLFVVLLFSAGLKNLHADEDNSKIGPISQKLALLDVRFQTLEENQQLILRNQEQILKTLDQLKIWARRN